MALQIKKDSKRLPHQIRLVLIDDYIHKDLWSIRFNKTIAIITITSFILLIAIASYFITSRTVIRHTIPGYPSAETKAIAIENLMKLDSLQRVIDMWAFQISNIQRVVSGRDPLEIDSMSVISAEGYLAESLSHIAEDSLLREQVKQTEMFSLSHVRRDITQIEGMHFYPPVKGMVTEAYNKDTFHPYIDIAAPANTTVCAALDGTVISAVWNDDTGYTMHIQHSNDIISVYKHNEKLLKKTGDKVKAGTPIALLGSTGTLSTGPHLHFELWHKGEAIDPAKYINF